MWSIGHRRPLAIALCSGLILLLLSSLYLAAWALPQCLASSCCEAGLSSSFPAGSRSELGVWCWMLTSWGCVRSSPTSSSEFVLLLVPVPLAPTALHLGSSLAIGCCRRAVERCWRMSGFSVALSLSSSKFRIRRARLTSHWSWRCEVWFLSWSHWTTRCLEHDKSCSGLANPDCDISVRTPLSVNCTAKVDERIHFPDGLSTDCDWCVGSGVNLHQLCFLLADLESCPSWYGLQAGGLVLHLSVVVWQERQVISRVEVIQLRPGCPLYPVVPACCGGLHDPVDDQKEEKWWQQAPLTDSSLDLEAFWRERSCSSCPGRYSGWGRWSSPGIRSASAASTASLCPHCRRPSHSLWSWCRGGSSTPATAPL